MSECDNPRGGNGVTDKHHVVRSKCPSDGLDAGSQCVVRRHIEWGVNGTAGVNKAVNSFTVKFADGGNQYVPCM